MDETATLLPTHGWPAFQPTPVTMPTLSWRERPERAASAFVYASSQDSCAAHWISQLAVKLMCSLELTYPRREARPQRPMPRWLPEAWLRGSDSSYR